MLRSKRPGWNFYLRTNLTALVSDFAAAQASGFETANKPKDKLCLQGLSKCSILRGVLASFAPPPAEMFFFHSSELLLGGIEPSELSQGDRLEFELGVSRDGRPAATFIRYGE